MRKSKQPSPFVRGVLETAGVLTLFLAFGLASAAVADRATRAPSPYPGEPVASSGEPSPADSTESTESTESAESVESVEVWLIDGFNVLHTGLLGGRDRSEWWTEPRRAELLSHATGFDDPRAELWVVFDGPRAADEPVPADARLRQVFAPSADAWLLDRVRSEATRCVGVVTADRRLADRARHRGAQVVSPQVFLDRCRDDRGSAGGDVG